MELKNKVVLITGAARGLGRELAGMLAAEGSLLALVDRETIADEYQNAKTYLCDLSDFAQRKRLIAEVGKIDILINCAGVGSHSRLGQMSVNEVERVMQVNAIAPLELIAGLSPLGLVVNIGSVAGEMSLPSMSLYAASKSALHVFHRAAALEGVNTLLVILGPLRGTGFAQSIQHPLAGQPKWYRDLDLPVEKAARLIVQGMKNGRREIVAPWWYRLIFLLYQFLTLSRLLHIIAAIRK